MVKKLVTKMISNKLTLSVVLVASLVASVLNAVPAFAQTGSIEGNMETEIAYMTEYPRAENEAESEVTVQTEYHLYRPGETVRVMGTVSEEIRQETESDTITVQLLNTDATIAGEQQATVSADGEYSATIDLDATADPGEYFAGSRIEVQASLLGLLDAEIVAQLESPRTSFVVGAESSHEIQAGGGETFTIGVASSSNVDNVGLDEDAKKLSFTVEGETGTEGVTEITVPKAMLSGEMMVLIDGEAVSPSSSDVILKSETSADVTFEINYSHSEHTVEVTGTNVVPEFPLAALVMALAVGSAILLVSKTGLANSLKRF
jgi:hypothetical protein